MIRSNLFRTHRLLRGAAMAFSAFAATAVLTCALQARPVPANLGNGLDKLVANNLAVTESAEKGVALRGSVTVAGKTYVDEVTAAVAQSALIESATGRLLVRVTFTGVHPLDDTIKAMTARAASLKVTAVDRVYRGIGVVGAYVDVNDVSALASTPGVAAVILEWKPRHNKVQTSFVPVGTAIGPGNGNAGINTSATVGETMNKIGLAFDQGVTQHRIDQINQYYNSAATLDWEGTNMQVGCISNSFDADTTGSSATDVASYDLPGSSTDPVGNTTPVYVLQDDLTAGGDDEGRAMCQIVHKMAPKAKIAFATADSGEPGFANNIRGLAGIAGYTNSGQTFAADSICDDVGYYDEPFFQDGIISGGIEDAAKAGVSYFSSAANDIGTNGYDSDTRWVANGSGLTAAAGNTALAGTNIDLTGVPTNLYAAGFHNFNPAGMDVAQTVNITTNGGEPPTEFQWNDPYDQNTTTTGNSTIFPTTPESYVSAPVYVTITTPVTAGTKYEFVEAATNNSGFDGIVTVYKSDGTTVLAGPQDTGVDETVRISAPANDTGFVVEINHYGTTTGSFTLTAYSYTGFSTPAVSTSLSVLVFNTAGAYISASSLTTDATTTNQPLQLGYTYRASGQTQVQYVIARTVVPAAGFSYPTHIRYLIPGNGASGIGPAEYFTYASVTTGGHAMSPSCNGCAAFSVFRPSLPEYFSSPGPVTIYYDTNDNRLATPQVRLQPHLGFADAANTSFFSGDTTSDPDTNPNFSGTSAAGPHGAAIAALVLQSHGGRRSVTPAQMTSLLERSTFPHDLDSDYASGSAKVTGGTTGTGKVTITINSDNSTNGGQGKNDPKAFSISYVGGSAVTSIVFNPGGTSATAGNVSGGNNGVTYSTTATGGTATYFENSLPGAAFFPSSQAFLQPTTGTVTATAAYTNLSGSTNQYYTMTLTPTSTFSGGNVMYFTVGRGVARSATTGNVYNAVTSATTGAAYYVADIFGGGVILPEGTVITPGMTFSGSTADGGSFTGTIVNRLGSGWSKTDGYGFVNAQTAVSQTVQ